MSTLVSGANINFSGLWNLIDSTSFQDTEAANTALTTSFVLSAAFTPGAITIDAIGLKLASVAGATGTITVALDSSGTVTGTSVTVNIANLPTCTTANNEGGWYFFKLASPVTLVAATAYKVKAEVSVGASAVNLYRSATAGDWARALRTTTTQTTVSGDTLLVCGDDNGTTANQWTVTMNNADAGASNWAGIGVCKNGTLAYGTSASTAYYLQVTGNGSTLQGVYVYSGGTLNIGTSGTNMPSTSSAVLEFACTSDNQYGLLAKNGSTVNAYGLVRSFVFTKLNGDIAANAGTIVTADNTGWFSGDVLAIAATSTTATETESITSGSPTGTSIPVSVGGGSGGNTTQYSHKGSSIQNGVGAAEVINLTRNVKIRSSATSFSAFVTINAGATAQVQYVEIYRAGLTNASTAGAFTGCSVHDTRLNGSVTFSAGSISSVVCFNLNTVGTGNSGVFSGVVSITNLYMFLVTSNNTAAIIFTVGGTNNVTINAIVLVGSTGSAAGYGYQAQGSGSLAATGLVAHACKFASFICNTSGQVVTLYAPVFWASQTSGSITSTSSGTFIINIVGMISFGNPSAGDIAFNNNSLYLISLWNSILGSTTKISGLTSALAASFVRRHKDGQTTAYITNYVYGTIQASTSIRHTATGYAWQMTPSSATNNLILPGPTPYDRGFQVTINANQSLTITVYVYYDSSYNGSMPTLVVPGGLISGVGSPGSDITASAPSGNANTWQQLSVTVTPTESGIVEWYVWCNGTAGNVYVQDTTDAQSSILPNTDSLDIANRGLPSQWVYNAQTGPNLNTTGLYTPVDALPVLNLHGMNWSQSPSWSAAHTATVARTYGAVRASSWSAAHSAAVTRSQALKRALSISIAHNATVARTQALVRALAISIAHSATVSRSQVLTRALAFSIAHVATVSRSTGFVRALTISIAHTATLSRHVGFARALASSIAHNATVARTYGAVRMLTSSIAHSAVLTRQLFKSAGLRQAYLSTLRTTLYQSALRLTRWLAPGSKSTGGVQMLATPVGSGTAYLGTMEANQPLAMQLQPDRLGPGEVVVSAFVKVEMAPDGSVNKTTVATTLNPGGFLISQALCGSVSAVVIDDAGTGCDGTTKAVLGQPTYPGMAALSQTVVATGGVSAVNLLPDPITGIVGGFAYLSAPAVSFQGAGSGMAAHAVVPMTGVVVVLGNANAVADAKYYVTAVLTLSSGREEQLEIPPFPGQA